MVIPWPAGGSSDLTLRALGDVAAKHLGQPFIYDNKPGASGTLGPATMAAGAKPDGYTIAQMPITVMRLPLMQKVSWNAEKDFTYIVHLTGYTFGITTKADGQFKTWDDVVKYAKANPGKVTYGTPGAGTIPAHRHGADRGQGRHQADHGSLQGRRGNQCGRARRPHDASGRFDRLEAARRCQGAAPADAVDA